MLRVKDIVEKIEELDKEYRILHYDLYENFKSYSLKESIEKIHQLESKKLEIEKLKNLQVDGGF